METIVKIIKLIVKYWKEASIVVLLALSILFGAKACTQSKEITRLEDNYYAMCDSAKEFKTESGEYASKTRDQELTIKELEAQYSGAKATIKDLNLKLKNVKQYQSASVTIHDTATVFLHDTVIDTKYASQTGSYSNNCTDVKFIVNDSTAFFDVTSNIPIDIVIATEKEGKWYQFWKFPRKKINTTTATTSCPNSSVIINTVTIKK